MRTSSRRRVLDWILDAFRILPAADVHFVAGYRIEDILHLYPDISFSFNPRWRETGPLGSLLSAPLPPDRPAWICYSDVVFTAETVKRLQEAPGDAVIGVDTTWRRRYGSRPSQDLASAEKVRLEGGRATAAGTALALDSADAEFAGLLRLSPAALKPLFALREAETEAVRRGSIPFLLDALITSGLEVRAVDIGGRWAELNEPRDLARFVLGTKAQTLERLSRLVKRSRIGAQHTFTAGTWAGEPDAVLARLRQAFGDARLAVRSSARSEDGWSESRAGAFASVLDVPGHDPVRVRSAVDEVIRSYGDGHPDHEILVQEMLGDVRLSGVVFTRTLGAAAPWYVVNYDDESRSTTSVTSGRGEGLKTAYVHRAAAAPPRIEPVMAAVRELEDLLGHDHLDVEFAVLADGTVYVLQVRPVAVGYGLPAATDEDVERTLARAEAAFDERQARGPFVLGRRTVFGVMPDWNPAEIIGTKPRRLALSLYRRLITDDVWARQRAEYGYRDVRPHPLMTDFAGHPYVDVRACLNSFVPAGLPEGLAARLVEHGLDRIGRCPALHDKVEFQVAFTCIHFDFDAEAGRRLGPAGFSEDEIRVLRGALSEITRNGMARAAADAACVGLLEERRRRIEASDLGPLDRAYALLEDCRAYGTPPFAHLARGAFVAVTLLRSLEACGAASGRQADAFLNSLHTVTRALTLDGRSVAENRLDWTAFVERYGHLRPGTYEITCPAYADDPELYLRPFVESGRDSAPPPFDWEPATRRSLGRLLRDAGLPQDLGAFEQFLRTAIEGREQAKFAFTRNLSRALDALARAAEPLGVSREDLSHVSIEDALRLRTGAPHADVAGWLRERAREGREQHRVTTAVELPPLLFTRGDLRVFELSDGQPNFVTRGRVTAETRETGGPSARGGDLKGRIVLIPQADPGYDWLFGHGIAGLITLYGGANSHMTIRAAELGLPAAIGVGERLYTRLVASRVLELDCETRQIRVIR